MPNPEFSSLEHPSATKLQLLGGDVPWTPALTAVTTPPTLGTGAQQNGRAHRNGTSIDIWCWLAFGSSGSAAGSGEYRVPLPPGHGWDAAALNIGMAVGQFRLIDASTGDNAIGVVVVVAASDQLRLLLADGTFVTHANPWAWAASDALLLSATYLSDIT